MKSCNNCDHCVKVNKNHLYAVCDETGKSFMLWQENTRDFFCNKWCFVSSNQKKWQKELNAYLNPHLNKFI